MNTTNPTYRFVYKWRAFTYSLGITRIALLILSVGLFLLMAAQGQDIIIGLAERGVLVSQLFLLLASYWAISIWYWSRILLNIRFPDAPKATSAFTRFFISSFSLI